MRSPSYRTVSTPIESVGEPSGSMSHQTPPRFRRGSIPARRRSIEPAGKSRPPATGRTLSRPTALPDMFPSCLCGLVVKSFHEAGEGRRFIVVHLEDCIEKHHPKDLPHLLRGGEELALAADLLHRGVSIHHGADAGAV